MQMVAAFSETCHRKGKVQGNARAASHCPQQALRCEFCPRLGKLGPESLQTIHDASLYEGSLAVVMDVLRG